MEPIWIVQERVLGLALTVMTLVFPTVVIILGLLDARAVHRRNQRDGKHRENFQVTDPLRDRAGKCS